MKRLTVVMLLLCAGCAPAAKTAVVFSPKECQETGAASVRAVEANDAGAAILLGMVAAKGCK